MKQLVRYLPAVHEIQKEHRFHELIKEFEITEQHLTKLVKEILEQYRNLLLQEKWTGPKPGNQDFIQFLFIELNEKLKNQFQYTLKQVINGTGTILHTNLGRARMSDRAIEHVVETAKSYSNLEYKLEEGERGSRHAHAEKLIKEITGAEAAMVVNNNAAAVYLILRELAHNKEVIVSRGELVEIGGSFRISSIMEESGANLVEVGTTNKTHLQDYERAINENTAMLMKVHTSNFKVIGFTKSVGTEELAQLGAAHENVLFYEDLGSGALYNYQKHGIGEEPVVSEVLAKGVDIVSFSGDKLLGGPQAGIIAGKKELIDRLKKNQLARVLRVDKLTIAALEGTLIDYLKGEESIKNIPVVRDLLTSKETLKERTESFKKSLLALRTKFEVHSEESVSQVGGGTMPDVELPTYVAVLRHQSMSAEQVTRKLRTEFTPAIITRIQKEEVIIDLRCMTEEEEQIVLQALSSL
ncbi:L-seryl-tRNA(Sec) selenium transferase [Robertmurraya kyonggiensis]|uniref:L-seryl-tRNA(Sec) selenium transferase n=1 Tax=Robertmurraya kyonggiensis TaxID=1037680 RepID=A0A4V5P2A3_9BACI|nr:L-seryl-tRNA(Sec) selenium transferase [Robertmurraya kyonggiensis]TKC19240.1 L-seryl-tRNA(Sec) selenium transferase [Robertmurraya kyonggiensis]